MKASDPLSRATRHQANATVPRPPALLIRLELDARPVLWMDAATEADEIQLRQWLDTHAGVGDAIGRLQEAA